MKKIIALFLITAFLLVGCAKEEAAPEAQTETSEALVPEPLAEAQEELETPEPVGDERCTDSDGGINYAVKGKVYGVNDYGIKYEKEDVCVPNRNYINEYFCSELGRPQTDIHECENACEDGVCI